MKALFNGSIVLPHNIVSGKALLFDDKIIGVDTVQNAQAKGADMINAQGAYICPGLVDVHIHGYLGADVSDGDKQGIIKMAQGVIKNGVTSFLPTTMTVPMDEITAALKNVRDLMDESRAPTWQGAQVLGAHMEGPFINVDKKGAQAASAILAPDADKVLPYQDVVKLITIAPEVEGGMAFIERIKRESDIVLSIGHTNADYETALCAIHRGATHITHTFNAMTGLNHRNPGVVGAALATPVYCELIADAFHVHPGVFTTMVRAKGDHLVLITDCVRAGGMPDGEYTLGGQPIFLKGIECRMQDGTIAGSVLRLNKAVKNLRDHAGVTLQDAVRAASLNPANSIGMGDKKGSLEAGKDADIILMDENCDIQKAFLSGRCIE